MRTHSFSRESTEFYASGPGSEGGCQQVGVTSAASTIIFN